MTDERIQKINGGTAMLDKVKLARDEFEAIADGFTEALEEIQRLEAELQSPAVLSVKATAESDRQRALDLVAKLGLNIQANACYKNQGGELHLYADRELCKQHVDNREGSAMAFRRIVYHASPTTQIDLFCGEPMPT